jgi:hypothetical protein
VIKLGKGGKPLMVGGKVVTNCDCCAGANQGACCDPGNVCTLTTATECAAIGGRYFGDGSACVTGLCTDSWCTSYPTGISGSVSWNFSGTTGGNTRTVSGSSTFTHAYTGASLSFYLSAASFTDHCTAGDVTFTQADYLPLFEFDIYCNVASGNPLDDGWYVHLFLSLANFCGYQVSFKTSSAFDAGYTKIAFPGGFSGTYSVGLSVDGGSPYGGGSCTTNLTLT